MVLARLVFDSGGGAEDFLVPAGLAREQLDAAFASRDVKSSRILRDEQKDLCRLVFQDWLCAALPTPPPSRSEPPASKLEPAMRSSFDAEEARKARDAFLAALHAALASVASGAEPLESLFAPTAVGSR